jgi:tetratricopeptide (TPR) repeat protein
LYLSFHQRLKLLILTCEHLKLQVPLAKYLKVELDLMKKHKHSPIQEYSETIVGLVLAKIALSEFDDCCLEYIKEVRSLLDKAELNTLHLFEIASDLSYQFKKFEEAIEILEHAKKDPNHEYVCLIKMAKIKADHLKKFDEGLQNCHEALNLCQSMEDAQFQKCVVFRILGETYFGQKNYLDSLKYFEKAMEEMNKTSKDPQNPYFTTSALSQFWINIAKTQCELDMPKTALSSIKKAWNFLREVDEKKHPNMLSNLLITKGRCYRKMGKYKKAIASTSTAIEQAFTAYEFGTYCPDWPLEVYTIYTFLGGCAKLANLTNAASVDETYAILIRLMCNYHKNSDEFIQIINETKNACYPVDDQELFMSKLKHVVDHNRPLMLSDAPPDFLPKLSRYLNSYAISNLLKTSVSQLMNTEYK